MEQKKKHFPPIISLDYISIKEEQEGSLRLEKGCSYNTSKISGFLFRLSPKMLNYFLFKMKNKNFIWLQKKDGKE